MLDVEPTSDRADATRCLEAGRRRSADSDRESSRSSPAPTDIERDDLTGLSLGRYALGARIGSGGMGHVFRARHRQLQRDLAIKFMAADLSSVDECRRRFEQETLALGALQHPHIVNAVDAGRVDGLQYLVTEFVDGEDLSQLVERFGALRIDAACGLIRQAALGLAHSHSRGFVHRDIKPSNLIVSREGCLKILDFGLVRSACVNHALTDVGQALGTWDFLAPEQAQDASNVDHRCDIYSLGCTLLFLLSGGVPFGGEEYGSAASKLNGHLHDVPAWLQNPPDGIPDRLLQLLEGMLAKSPDERIDSAAAIAAALAGFATQDSAATAGLVARRGGDRRRTQRWSRPMSLVTLGCIGAVVALAGALILDAETMLTEAPSAKSDAAAVVAAPIQESQRNSPNRAMTATGPSHRRPFPPPHGPPPHGHPPHGRPPHGSGHHPPPHGPRGLGPHAHRRPPPRPGPNAAGRPQPLDEHGPPQHRLPRP